jgi:hypothetical protein
MRPSLLRARTVAAACLTVAPLVALALDPLGCTSSAFVEGGDSDASADVAVVPVVVPPFDSPASDDAGDATGVALRDGDSSACIPVGTGALGVIGCPCPTQGVLACAGNAQKEELICNAGAWAGNGTCPADQRCDSRPGLTQGSCAPVLAACASATSGQSVCTDWLTTAQCGPDLLTSTTQACQNQTCIDGGCAGVCGYALGGFSLTNPVGQMIEARCMGNVAQQCTPAGTWMTSATCPSQCCSGGCSDSTSDPENCGSCGHDCAGGLCSAGVCQPAAVGGPADGSDLAGPIAVDSEWIYATTSSGVLRAPLSDNDGALAPLVTGRAGAYGIATNGTYVYWTEPPNGLVMGVAASGGAPFTVASGQTNATLVAVDAVNLYWTATTPANAGLVVREPLSGVADGGSPVLAFTGPYPVTTLAVDATSIYFTEAGCQLQGSDEVCTKATSSVPLGAIAGSDASAPLVLADDNTAAGIAVGPANLYWTTASKCQENEAGITCNDDVETASLAGSAPVTLASHVSLNGPLLVDGARVYAAGYASVYAVPLDGGTVFPLASGAQPAGLAQNDATLYWTDPGAKQITRLTKPLTP